jgi:hypothetical protein
MTRECKDMGISYPLLCLVQIICIVGIVICILIIIKFFKNIVDTYNKRDNKTKKQFNFIFSDQLKTDIEKFLMKKKYHEISTKNKKTWEKMIGPVKYFSVKYYISFQVANKKTIIEFWWKDLVHGNYTYPLTIYYSMGPHYRLLLHYKKLMKIIERHRK